MCRHQWHLHRFVRRRREGGRRGVGWQGALHRRSLPSVQSPSLPRQCLRLVNCTSFSELARTAFVRPGCMWQRHFVNRMEGSVCSRRCLDPCCVRRVLTHDCAALQTHYHSAAWYIRQGLPVPAGVADVRPRTSLVTFIVVLHSWPAAMSEGQLALQLALQLKLGTPASPRW